MSVLLLLLPLTISYLICKANEFFVNFYGHLEYSPENCAYLIDTDKTRCGGEENGQIPRPEEMNKTQDKMKTKINLMRANE